MKKTWILTTVVLAVLALYVGMAVRTPHPMDRLFRDTMAKMNRVDGVNFKSGLIVTRFEDGAVAEQWQAKREGTFNAWTGELDFRNVRQFSHLAGESQEDVEQETSLTEEGKGEFILLPVEEVRFTNGIYREKNRQTQAWTSEKRASYDLLELLPLDAELMNRYAKHYESDNRGKFVVFFFSVQPEYLSRTFPAILESYGYDFPAKFTEGTIKTLVYPDTLLPRRVYSIFRVQDPETGDTFEFNLDTYFSEREAPESRWAVE